MDAEIIMGIVLVVIAIVYIWVGLMIADVEDLFKD